MRFATANNRGQEPVPHELLVQAPQGIILHSSTQVASALHSLPYFPAILLLSFSHTSQRHTAAVCTIQDT
jgi:hypothetical protein